MVQPAGCQTIYHTNAHNPYGVTFPCRYQDTLNGGSIALECRDEPVPWTMTTPGPVGPDHRYAFSLAAGWADVRFIGFLEDLDTCFGGDFFGDDRDPIAKTIFILPSR